jgi:hypothetical protein
MVKKVGKYEIGKTIGEGTFGKVKLAINTETNEKVAIKVCGATLAATYLQVVAAAHAALLVLVASSIRCSIVGQAHKQLEQQPKLNSSCCC